MNELMNACISADLVSQSGKQRTRKVGELDKAVVVSLMGKQGALGIVEEVRTGMPCVVCIGLARAGGAECGPRGRYATGDDGREARLAHKMPLFCPGPGLRSWTTITW